MSYVSETIWVAEGSISSRDIVVVVADITDGSVAISEETGTSSQQVRCSIDKLMEALGVKTREDLLPELKKRFGNACGYDIARDFRVANPPNYYGLDWPRRIAERWKAFIHGNGVFLWMRRAIAGYIHENRPFSWMHLIDMLFTVFCEPKRSSRPGLFRSRSQRFLLRVRTTSVAGLCAYRCWSAKSSEPGTLDALRGRFPFHVRPQMQTCCRTRPDL